MDSATRNIYLALAEAEDRAASLETENTTLRSRIRALEAVAEAAAWEREVDGLHNYYLRFGSRPKEIYGIWLSATVETDKALKAAGYGGDE